MIIFGIVYTNGSKRKRPTSAKSNAIAIYDSFNQIQPFHDRKPNTICAQITVKQKDRI